LNRGEGFDEMGRATKVPRADFYTGKHQGWKPKPLYSSASPSSDSTSAEDLPRVQHSSFSSGSDARTAKQKEQDETRKEWVKRAFQHLWGNYKEHAWGYDELKPLSGGKTTPFNGWGATIFDALCAFHLLSSSPILADGGFGLTATPSSS
jgi:hypothetical protein